MFHTLPTLIQKVTNASSVNQLCGYYMDAAGELFGSQHWGIYIHSWAGQKSSIYLKGLPDSFIDYYSTLGAALDKVMEYVVCHHAPAHEQIIFTEATWKQSELYQIGCGKIYDHEHIMTGPIVGDGKLVGTVQFARTSGNPAYNTQDLLQLSAICAHISAKLALLRSQHELFLPKHEISLTARELQIAALVAKGLTNAEIAAELWISQNTVKQTLKRIFRKLDVSARAEMVARLQLSRVCN
ncbi:MULTISPECIES: LuxR C-terminal-related transcriptional regulator [Calothrix]|uniref:LuxR family transcriptional regulator n=2 Tax=Calothrix TaxID=1186 RepID=A0ABR8A9M0_9CYAN|nr:MULTISPECIES: LuxR C-terminal-related transcriptional regulator [Calothrix]MBD2195761.1 LuxR family transcriptional regulator [Calothrix parietina FACHB-288]MBD2224417.1 LuxR family transcriptional regulator [Calothrix anomala FACHB-343]